MKATDPTAPADPHPSSLWVACPCGARVLIEHMRTMTFPGCGYCGRHLRIPETNQCLPS